MLNLEILQEFVAFSEYGTLSAAAEALHISQPSLSRSMQKLEDSLEVQLFDHAKNKLTLNDNGKLAVTYARRVLDSASSMEKAVRLYDRQSRTISIGSIAPFPLWEILPKCYDAFPGMSVNGEIRDETTLLQGLLAKETYQMIILPYEFQDERCRSRHIGDENLMLCVPKSHPLAKRKSVSFQDFDGETMIVFSGIGFWKPIHQNGLPHCHFLYQDDHNDVVELERRSNLACFITDCVLQKNGLPDDMRVAIPIRDASAHQSYYLTWQKSDSPRLRSLTRSLFG